MTEESTENNKNHFCLGCLRSEHKIYDYEIQYAHFLAIFEVSTIKLCYLCKRMAQHAEVFIQNVQSNQILLENCLGDPDKTIQEALTQLQPHINLTHTYLDAVDIAISESNNSINKDVVDDKCIKITSKNSKEASADSKTEKNNRKDKSKTINKGKNMKLVHLEEIFHNGEIINTKLDRMDNNMVDVEKKNIKVELIEDLEHLEGEFIDENDDFQDPYIKEEDDFPLKVFLKKELPVEGAEVKGSKTTLRKKKKGTSKKKEKHKFQEETKLLSNESLGIERIIITEEECMQEREQLALATTYINCTYKCTDCIKGFNFKAGYDVHLERHSLSAGAFQCDICKLRMKTEEKLFNHKRYHTIRYRCTECGLTRISRSTIKDHYSAFHHQGEKQFPCTFCGKAFKRQVSQRKHIRYTHGGTARVTCGYCGKTYKNKDVLKSHMMHTHPAEVWCTLPARRHTCGACGAAFRSASHLRHHAAKHGVARDYYCVECDKAFKTEAVLKQHLKTAQPHVNYIELPLSCTRCEKKFAIKRDLDRHINSVHLDVKPFKCDKCDKAYVNNWSLVDHKRHVHEGYKRPLRYPCRICDKVFDRNSILKAHIRTHTGERPYQCSKCPAQFSQSGVLATHDRLIHLRLRRDGRPKHILGNLGK